MPKQLENRDATYEFKPYALYWNDAESNKGQQTYSIIEAALYAARELVNAGCNVRVYDHSKDEGETLLFEYPDLRMKEPKESQIDKLRHFIRFRGNNKRLGEGAWICEVMASMHDECAGVELVFNDAWAIHLQSDGKWYIEIDTSGG